MDHQNRTDLKPGGIWFLALNLLGTPQGITVCVGQMTCLEFVFVFLFWLEN
jgi:hypothetical protein